VPTADERERIETFMAASDQARPPKVTPALGWLRALREGFSRPREGPPARAQATAAGRAFSRRTLYGAEGLLAKSMEGRATMPQGFTTDPPIVTTLLTCDGFNQSVLDGKPTFVGVFDDISVLQFPFQMGFVVVTVLVGVLEQVDTQVYMSRRNPDLTETRAPFGAISVVQPPANGGLVNNVIVHAPFFFPAPGRYDVQVFGNQAFLAYKPIIIRQLQPPGAGGAQVPSFGGP
jgi:hypothetical protein